MRELAYGARQSGRSQKLINELPDDAEYVYIVAATFTVAMYLKTMVKELRGYDYAKKVAPICLNSLHRLDEVDAQKIYFDHTAYEFATARQLSKIYEIEDRRDSIWNIEL